MPPRLCSLGIIAATVLLLPVRTTSPRTEKVPGAISPSYPTAFVAPALVRYPGAPLHRRMVLKDGAYANIQGAAGLISVQTKNPGDLAVGRLLVASRGLSDPIFAQTVILLVEYDAHGVLGLMLNRRTDLPVSRAFHHLKAARNRSDLIYLGGPVQTPAAFALLRSTEKVKGAEQVFGSIYFIAAKSIFEKTIAAHPDPGEFHVYVGYAGWTRDQLRKEVALGAWFIFQANEQQVFNSNPDSLWQKMIAKTELKMANSDTARSKPRPELQISMELVPAKTGS